jgi:hypothetical protein
MSASLRLPIGIGCITAIGLFACSGTSNTGNGNGTGQLGTGGAAPVGGMSTGSAGAAVPGGGGAISQGNGGTASPPGGGGYQPGTGNSPGTGNQPSGGNPPIGGSPGTGGGAPGGASGAAGAAGGGGGAAGGGQAGASGGPALISCDQNMETSAHPITEPCADFKATPMYATKLQLGPYGGQMDVNVGKGFENPDPMDSGTCPTFAAIFGEDPKITNQLLDVGMQPCNATAPNTGTCLDMKLYSIYRPAKWPEGKIPVLSWGNGTCAQPEGYGALLRYIASFGFFIVAANNREVGNGAPLRKGLDFAAAADADMNSPYFGHLDMSKVGVMGHSQGSGAAGTAASDSRVKAVILYNGGTSNAKPYLAISGDMDIGATGAGAFSTAMASAAKGSYMYFHNPAGVGGIRGHLVLMMTPQRLAEQSLQFWQMTLNGDQMARDKFMAQKTSADYDFGAKGF